MFSVARSTHRRTSQAGSCRISGRWRGSPALPTLEKALELAKPLEGAIDRVGRFVDRLSGGANARRPEPGRPDAPDGPIS